MSNNQIRVHILGAASGTGEWFIKNIFSKKEWVVEYFGYDVKLGDNVNLVLNNDYGKYSGNFKSGDVVFMAVPASVFADVFDGVCKILERKQDFLFVPATSVQGESISLLRENEVNFLGLHPLFSPTVNIVSNLSIAVIYGSKHTGFESIFKDIGFELTSFDSAEEHDLYMSYIQALPHYIFVMFLSLLSKSDLDLEKIFRLATPPFKVMHAFSSRAVKLPVTTLKPIQQTTQSQTIREKVNEFVSSFCVDEFDDILSSLKQKDAQIRIDEGDKTSKVIVDSVFKINSEFDFYIKKGSSFFLRDANGNIRVVKLIKQTNTSIHFEEQEDISNKCKKYFMSNNARDNYKNTYNFRVSTRQLDKKSIQILNEDEVADFISEDSMCFISKKNTFKNSAKLSEDFIEKILINLVKGVFRIKFISSHKKRGELEMVKIELILHPEYEIESVLLELTRYFAG